MSQLFKVLGSHNIEGAAQSGGDANPWPWKEAEIQVLGLMEPSQDQSISSIKLADVVGHVVRFIKIGEPFTADLVDGRVNIEYNPTTRKIVRVWMESAGLARE